MRRASKDETITSAFVMEPSDLRQLHDFLVEEVGPVTISARCADKLERSFESVEAILGYDNPATRALETVRLRSRAAQTESSASVRFDSDPQRNIAISIDGPEDVVLRISERLDELLASMRPFYWRAARISSSWVLLPTFLLLASLPWLRQILGSQASVYAVMFMGGALIGWLSALLDGRKNRLFPSGVFAIANGAKRHHNLQMLRTVVLLGFIVSLAATVVGALLF